MIRYDFWGDGALAAGRFAEAHPAGAAAIVELAKLTGKNEFVFRGHWEMERTHTPVRFAGKIDWKHVENGDPEWCYAFNRHSFLVALGKAWRFTGEPGYAETARRLWMDWLDSEPLCEAARATTWRPIEAGLRCESWLRALWLLQGSPAFDAALLCRVEEGLGAHAGYLFASHGSFQKLSNWGVLQDHGLLLLGLAFGREEWCGIAAERLDGALHLQVLADGSHWEQSPLYHCEVLHCCLNGLLAARRVGFALPRRFVENTHKMARALAAWLRPDGLLLCQSDSDEVDARDLLALAAWLFEDGALKATAGAKLPAEALWSMAEAEGEYAALEGAPVQGSVLLADSGNAMLWDKTGPGAGFLHSHCGCLGSGHGHADLLHVDLVEQGESILCDSGRYTYVDSPLRARLKSAAAHNCVRVDGREFSETRGSWGYTRIAEPLKGQSRFTPGADYLCGAHLGYLDLGLLHRRHILRLGTGLWLWWDALYDTGDAPHSYEHFYHFGPEGQFTPGPAGGVYQGRRVSARLALCGAACATSTERAPGSREYNRLERHDCLTATHRARGFASLASVVATGPAGEAPCLTVQMHPVTLKASGWQLPAENAQALSIDLNGRVWTVLLVHQEAVAEVDLLTACGREGYGKVLVFPPEQQEAVCLAW